MEDQEHVRGPLAEALDGGDFARHLVIRQLVELLELELTRDHVLGERAQVAHLRARQPRRAHDLRISVEKLLWCWSAAAELVGQSRVDRARGLRRELLPDDRAQQRAVWIGGAA